jgi:hypothetical protein
MTKILLAGGCSYTDPNFMSQDQTLSDEKSGGWAMWPEHLGNNLGLKVINTGQSGLDNLTIHNKIISGLLNHRANIGLVCVLWSGYNRFRFMNNFSVDPINLLKRAERIDSRYLHPTSYMFCQDELIDWWAKLASHKNFNASEVVKGSFVDSFTYMNSIAEICDLRKIPYIFYQGVHPIKLDVHPFNSQIFDKLKSFKEILKTPMAGHTEKRKNNIIGWPFMSAFGGHCVDSHRNSWSDALAVSENDYHPNAEAQKWISEIFMKKYQEITNV